MSSMEPQQFFVDQTTGISYAIEVPESGAFDSLQTLVEVSSLLANQEQGDQEAEHYTVVDTDTGGQQPRHTILAQRITQLAPAAVTSLAVTAVTSAHRSQPPVRLEKPTRKRGNGAAKVRPCHVCGELAGRHSYYGGECCPSCRAFFRRSVQSGYNESYCCVKDGDCEVSLRTRKNCQYCRYKKCLDIGMKTTWVLSEEERKEKFEGRKIRRKSKGKEGTVDEDDLPDVDRNLISEDEMIEVNELVRLSGYNEPSKLDMETDLIRDIIRLIAFRHPLPSEGQAQLREVLSRRFRKIAKSMKEFQQLPSRDRDEILQQNIPVLVELQVCTFFNPDLLWREQLSTLIGATEVEKLDRKLKSMEVKGLDDLKLNYLDMFSPEKRIQAEEEDNVTLSKTFLEILEIVRDIGCWPQDACEYVLLCKVLLFCPDLLQLTHIDQTQQTQNKFAILLYKYLNKKHQNEPGIAVSKLASGINIVSKCKQLHNLRMDQMKLEKNCD